MAEPTNTNPDQAQQTTPAQPQQAQPAQGITSEQLHAAIEKARLEEREKLRKQLEASEAKSTKLEKDLATATGEISKLVADIEAIKKGITNDGGVDVQKVIDQTAKAVSAQVRKEYGAKLDELQSQLESERNERSRLSAEQLRADLIAKAGGSSALIPELVRGNTAEEIAASIENAKIIFQRTLSSAGATTPTQQNANGNGVAVVPPVIPVTPSGGTDTTVENSGVRRMPMSEYAQKRAELKRQAAARYPKSIMR